VTTIQFQTPPDQLTKALGRNGFFKPAAVQVTQYHHQPSVVLENWTSQASIGRHRLVLPAEANALRALAFELNRIAATLP